LTNASGSTYVNEITQSTGNAIVDVVNGDLTLNKLTINTLNNDSSLTINTSATVDDLTNTGTMTVNNLSADNVTNTLGTLSVGADSFSVKDLTNSGTINSSAKNITVDKLENSGNVSITDASGSITGVITNSGELNVDKSTLTIAGVSTTGDKGTLNVGNNSAVSVTGEVINQTVNVDNSSITLAADSNALKDSILNVSGTSVVNVKDGVYTNYVLDELNSDSSARYAIDLSLSSEEQKADTFTLSNGGSGTIYISSINFDKEILNDCDPCELYVIQIIRSATEDAPE
jgi:hypothetical protein